MLESKFFTVLTLSVSTYLIPVSLPPSLHPEQRSKDTYFLKGNTDLPVSNWELPEETESWDDDSE